MRGLDAMVSRYAIDKSILRTCYSCGSGKTSKNSRGADNWFVNSPTDLVLCDNCYCRYFKHLNRRKGKFTWGRYGYTINQEDRQKAYRKKWNPINNKLFIVFRNRYIFLGWNPRKGICTQCAKVRRTAMHHLSYYIIFPWFATIELCCVCHRKRHSKK